jgi:hypothetical protein
VIRTATIAAFTLFALAFTACETHPPSQNEAQAVERQQEQYLAAQPIPAFAFSLERDVAIQLYAARNEEVATHTIWRGDTSVIEGDCASIGYPLPYDTSLTNPVTIERQRTHANSASWATGVLEQAEPNGLYSSKNSTATWIRCVYVIDERTYVVPVYIEGKVSSYPFPMDVDYNTGRATPATSNAPSVQID